MKRDWKKWLYAALIRAIKTFAESALAYIGSSAIVIGDVSWLGVLSAGAFGAVTSLLLSLKGLPEVDDEMETVGKKTEPPEQNPNSKVVNFVE